jgi:hypothetical protein
MRKRVVFINTFLFVRKHINILVGSSKKSTFVLLIITN